MIKVFISTNNNSAIKKFLIRKNPTEDCKEWVEIHIDYDENVFTAKKIETEVISDEWVEYKDYTFPSSLFNEFLNSDSKD